MSDYQAIGNNVLILPDPPEQKSFGGLLIPETSAQRTRSGKVVSVGPGRVTKKKKVIGIDLDIGEHIMFDDAEARIVKLDDVDHLVIDAGACLGVIE